MKIREYSAPLTVLAAGVLGFSLICIVSAAALANPANPQVSNLAPQDIVDSAFSNPISTAAALTAVEIYEYLPTPTPSAVLITSSPTLIASPTSTARIFVTWTPQQPTRTRVGRATFTSTPIPSRTPTNTHLPTFTSTFTPQPTPTDTDTPVPPTVTPNPTETYTPQPTDTNTSEPPPSPTSEPTQIPTSVNIPLPSEVASLP